MVVSPKFVKAAKTCSETSTPIRHSGSVRAARARKLFWKDGVDGQADVNLACPKNCRRHLGKLRFGPFRNVTRLGGSLARTSFFRIDKAMSSLLFVASAGRFTGYDPG